MNDYLINNINFEAVDGANIEESDREMLVTICRDIQRNPMHWEELRRVKLKVFPLDIWDSWFDDLEALEKKYKITILLPVTWEQLEDRARRIRKATL